MTVNGLLRAGAFCVGLIFVTATGALAQSASVSLGLGDYDSSQPIEITSEELAVDQQAGTATFDGNVIVGQGDLRMTCDRMLVEYGADPTTGESDIRVIRMFGGVTVVTAEEAAEADTAVYTLADETLVMEGDVLVTQGPTALSADKMTYNLSTGNGRMEGRVKTILQPDRQ